jgi:hypothetical protein
VCDLTLPPLNIAGMVMASKAALYEILFCNGKSNCEIIADAKNNNSRNAPL